MKKTPVVCLLIIICSLFVISCGNFSSADSYLANVYSKPETLIKKSSANEIAAETNLPEDVQHTETEIGGTETIDNSREPDRFKSEPDSEVLPAETEIISETENALQIANGENAGKYIITENGKKFHKETCRTVKSVKQYVSYDEAVTLGYEPCKICAPVND